MKKWRLSSISPRVIAVPDVKILIFNKNQTETLLLNKVCSRLGVVDKAARIEEVIPLVQSKTYNVAVIDHSDAYYSLVGDLFDKSTAILVTGPKEKKVREIMELWPREHYVDFYISSFHRGESDGLNRTLKKAIEHSCLMNEVHNLRRANEEKNRSLNEVYIKLKEINGTIKSAALAEREKRTAIQKQYAGLKRERQKVEDILKRLYTANDITSLIDIVSDIKEIVSSQGISIYLLDENETLGKFLKPLVWNNAILSYPDFTKSIVLLTSSDFAASAALNFQEINTASPQTDKRFSERYSRELDFALENILCIPITFGKEVTGLLEVYNKTGKDGQVLFFTESDQQILRQLCEHISIAINKLNLIQYDALTGLLRPDPFFEKVIQKLKTESKRHQEDYSYAIVMGDVDWFKNFNDKQGHSAGNRLLRELANLLKSSMREEDLLCRYGGEEFLFFLSSIKSREEAFIITERLRRKVSEQYFEGQEMQPRQNLTMSFGITNFTRDTFESPGAITKNTLKKIVDEADMALAVAKGKRKSLYPTAKDSPAPGLDKDNISIYPGNKGEKGKNGSEETIPEDRMVFGSYGRENSEKNSIRIFTAKENGQDNGTDIIPPVLISCGEDRRKFRRFLSSSLIIFQTNGEEKVTKTVDLSLGGIKIRTGESLNKGNMISLVLILGNRAVKAKGDVVYSSRQGEQPLFYSGIKFLNFSGPHRESLKDYLSSLSAKPGDVPE